MSELIPLSRDIVAIQIPSGDPLHLRAGVQVKVTQNLGGTVTVVTELGELARIESRDTDAIGIASVGSNAAKPKVDLSQITKESLEAQIWEQLKTCYDPEIPVNIVDLGLVYKCVASPKEAGGFKVEIDMTLTAPGCGMGPVLQKDVETKVAALDGVTETQVYVVFDPQWDQSLMSEAARLQLGFF